VCLIVVVLSGRVPASAWQAETGTLSVDVRSSNQPLDDAEVIINGVSRRTDASGTVTIELPTGTVDVTVTKAGFVATTVSAVIRAGLRQQLIVDLQQEPTVEETITVVASTRTDKRLEDQAMRVEVLGRDEIEEKMLMTPGDIVMMLNEMGGMRVQTTSPSIGAASVRIQGMRGKYTRVLSDGLPLFGDVGGLGLLQIPPMDLGQVEVIKGVASALYGAGAMGGVLNLLSRRPGPAARHDFLFNQSTRGATDAVTFLSGSFSRGWSTSLLAGGHWQRTADIDDDSWADLPGYERAIVRPRVFWDGGNGRTFFATAGVTFEDRHGGTLDGESLEATGAPYVESLDTRKYDAGGVGQTLINDRVLLTARAAFAHQGHDHLFGDVRESDRHDLGFGELAMRATAGRRQTWVAGIAIEHDVYRSQDVPRFDYSFTVPGVFAQYDIDVSPAFSLSASGRVDVHSEYGTFVSPRVSGLFRAGRWTSRLSVGTGFFGSTPITEETEAAGLTRLTLPQPLEAERGLSGSFDLTRTDGPFSYTATLFASRITDPLHVDRSPAYVLRNLDRPTANAGLELLGTFRREPFALTSTYTYVRASATVDGVEEDVPLTPRHGAGVVGMFEREDAGRVGIEWYFTGAQRLEENPYRTSSEAYMIVGVLAEKQFGRVRVFVNAENLTGVRQTRWDPLLRPTRAADGRWTVDAWAPLEGRNVNGGVRLEF
jgi:iron complex outermembrane receptor protein